MSLNVKRNGRCRSALIATAIALSFSAAPSLAEPAEEETGVGLTANVGLFSQYIFRGITYSREAAAIQGGFDLTHPSGLYAGVWSTSLSGVAISNASSEIDLYGGYTASVGPLALDAGLLYFHFPDGKYNASNEKYETLEAYLGATWSVLNVKYSHTLSDYFGFNSNSVANDFGMTPGGDSRGSGYIEANLNFDLGAGFSLGLHAGRQSVKNYERFSYNDYRIGLAKDLSNGFSAGAAYTDTDAESVLYTDARGLDTSRGKGLFWIKKTM